MTSSVIHYSRGTNKLNIFVLYTNKQEKTLNIAILRFFCPGQMLVNQYSKSFAFINLFVFDKNICARIAFITFGPINMNSVLVGHQPISKAIKTM